MWHFTSKKCRAFSSHGKMRKGCTLMHRYMNYIIIVCLNLTYLASSGLGYNWMLTGALQTLAFQLRSIWLAVKHSITTFTFLRLHGDRPSPTPCAQDSFPPLSRHGRERVNISNRLMNQRYWPSSSCIPRVHHQVSVLSRFLEAWRVWSIFSPDVC